MKVQIYAHKTLEDAHMSVAAGVDFVGVSAGEKGHLKDELSFAQCRNLFEALKDTGVMRVALTVAWEPAEIIQTVEAVQPDVIHLSGDIADLPALQVAELRRIISPVKIMQAIPVGGPAGLKLALAYQAVSDYFILDTDLKDFIGIGATGATHDWRLSAEIVQHVHIPVILAGGLKPENVGEAIRAVKPWAVDSFTHTNLPGSKRKDPAKVKAFVEAAKTTW
jgi:phosphoribosylanthranilate isomerase